MYPMNKVIHTVEKCVRPRLYFPPLSDFRHVVGKIDLAKLQSVVRNRSLLLYFCFVTTFKLFGEK